MRDASDIVIYVGGPPQEQNAMVEALETLRDDPILFDCILYAALLDAKDGTPKAHENYVAEVRRLWRLTGIAAGFGEPSGG